MEKNESSEVRQYYERTILSCVNIAQIESLMNSARDDKRIRPVDFSYLLLISELSEKLLPIKQYCEQIKDNPSLIDAVLLAAMREFKERF